MHTKIKYWRYGNWFFIFEGIISFHKDVEEAMGLKIRNCPCKIIKVNPLYQTFI